MKTEPIIFPSHVICLTEDGKEMEGKDGESWKNHSLPTDLSFTRRSSILGAPLNLVLLPTGQQRPSAAGKQMMRWRRDNNLQPAGERSR